MSNGGYRFGDGTRWILRNVIGAGGRNNSASDDDDETPRSTQTETHEQRRERLLQRVRSEEEKDEQQQQQQQQQQQEEGRRSSSVVDTTNSTSTTTTTSGSLSPFVPAVSLEGASWPDPDPTLHCSDSATARVDDVTRLNATEVDRVFMPRSVDDVRDILALARSTGHRVSMRGTKHSMGGHTISPKGYVIDMAKLNRVVSVDVTRQLAVVQPGAQWSDLIYHLNQYGLSPRTMQSYSTFSVGGTVAVSEQDKL